MEEKEFDYINVIPLVDIMLVLLTIVLVTATFIVQGSIPIRLPSAKHAEVKNIKSFQIVINEKGNIFFEGREIGLKELDEIAKNIDKDSQISIFADKSAKVQDLVAVLDILKKYEIKKAVIKTELIR
ncbi:MAG: biopolymer transporter ExbD [Thermodesulfobacterium geofontis]|uniref:Biopolymer transporter ExbD n=1 Tax=Thermodesulfobacterium geofontis TaxID=1295609 RepID=A0A2N7PPJ7_9BACT|nr:MAG: biopolymer transporter ExbD [Thermodesulfobacterium geofontis]PMP97273.1 MAG: biopolymer transporter ExbD [Thermodesulfobacterium geofontis]